jgi:hypothetical protein
MCVFEANKNFSQKYENENFHFNPTQQWSCMTWCGSAMLIVAMLTTTMLTTTMLDWSRMTCRTGAAWQLEIRALEPHDMMRLRNAGCYNADYRNSDYCNTNYRNANYCNANYRNADNRHSDFRNAYNRSADYRNADYCNADYWNARLSGIQSVQNEKD